MFGGALTRVCCEIGKHTAVGTPQRIKSTYLIFSAQTAQVNKFIHKLNYVTHASGKQ